MEDPPVPTGEPVAAPAPFLGPSEQTPRSVAEDQLAESFALDDSVGNPPGPAIRPGTPGGPARHTAARTDGLPSSSVGSQPPAPGGRRVLGRGQKKPRKKAPWWELPLLIAVAIVVAMLIKTFVVQPYYIPSESMENTLHGCTGCSGDRILVNKPIYDLRDPHPGDIVVFKAPPGWDDEPTAKAPSNPIVKAVRWAGQLIGIVPPDENDLVKRVIAVGGQTVRCCDANGNVEVSDTGPSGPWHSLNEPYIYQNLPWDPASAPGLPITGAASSTTDVRNFGPVTVPKGRLWVMGDHRILSADSRYHYQNDDRGNAMNSTVPVSSVIGKAVLIVWPIDRWTTLGTPSTFKTDALALSDPVAPPLASFAVALPIWMLRRRRRRRR